MILDDIISTLEVTLGASIGEPLRDVIYRTDERSTPKAAIAAGAGWIYGEVLLVLSNSRRLYLGWGEHRGWSDQFSLELSEQSAYGQGVLTDISAVAAPEWRAIGARPLRSAELRGANGTPHLLVLRFDQGGVVIGDGHETQFGDGDHILVHPFPDPQLAEFLEVFWSSPQAA